MTASRNHSKTPAPTKEKKLTKIEAVQDSADPKRRALAQTPSLSANSTALTCASDMSLNSAVRDTMHMATAHQLSCAPPALKELMTSSARDAVEQMAPADPLERMLAEQMVWCHERIRDLALRAKKPSTADLQCAYHAQCDAAMGTFRRGMIALRQYRAIRPPGPLIAVQQVNHAEAGDVVIAPTAMRRGRKSRRTN